MYAFLEYHVADAMTPNPQTIGPDQTLRELAELFAEHDFNAAPVCGPSGEVLGIVTKLDLLRAFLFDDEHMFPPYDEIMDQPVSSVMTREYRSVRPRTPLTKAMQMLVDLGAKSLVVIDGGQLVGMIAREDLMRALQKAAGQPT